MRSREIRALLVGGLILLPFSSGFCATAHPEQRLRRPRCSELGELPEKKRPDVKTLATVEILQDAQIREFINTRGAEFGLELTPDGKSLIVRGKVLSASAARRVLEFIYKWCRDVGDKIRKDRMARALYSYLKLRGAGSEFEKLCFKKGFLGRVGLTPFGKNLLMDILSAEDGTLFVNKPDPTEKAGKTAIRMGKELADYFSISQYDWSLWEDEIRPPSPRVVAASGGARISPYAVDDQKGTVRVMVQAKKKVRTDHLLVAEPDEESQGIYEETGLDSSLMSAHRAKVLRAMDNLVVLEVPISRAGKLGLALEKQGIASRPARALRSAAREVAGKGNWFSPALQALPIPMGPGGPFSAKKVGIANAESRDMMGVGHLWEAGMTGKGTVVGVIDSGLDLNHPDFKGKVIEYVDLTGDGNNDTLGHGTHVTGIIGGSGAASDGKYKGMAPDTKLVVFKVFGESGSTSEDTILAAMKKAASLPEDKRPDVLNMSLGGPGHPENDPLSFMANRLMLKNNIMVVAAAGNSGPWPESVSAPGNAQYILTVTGFNKERSMPSFPSRGPVRVSEDYIYIKPDISAVAGDVNLGPSGEGIQVCRIEVIDGKPVPVCGTCSTGRCVYAPGGVISTRSGDDKDEDCAVSGNPHYRYMTGTSMATPMAAGVAADVIGYLRKKGVDYKVVGVKAVIMETAADMEQKPEDQGAGIIDGKLLARTVMERVKLGIPVGNIAYMLSMRLTSPQREKLKTQERYVLTPLGILDQETGHLINNDADLKELIRELERAKPAVIVYRKPKDSETPGKPERAKVPA